jgi:hypothetical protein
MSAGSSKSSSRVSARALDRLAIGLAGHLLVTGVRLERAIGETLSNAGGTPRRSPPQMIPIFAVVTRDTRRKER